MVWERVLEARCLKWVFEGPPEASDQGRRGRCGNGQDDPVDKTHGGVTATGGGSRKP